MTINLDAKDKKLLSSLDENSRYTNAQLARKIQLSKPAVEYRIQRLLKNKAILQFYTVINFAKLGYSLYKVYFKFQNTSLQKEKEIVNFWRKENNVVWVAQCRGKSDLAISILAKNNFEFANILAKFTNKYSNFILDKELLLSESTSIYTDSKKKEFLYAEPKNQFNLDEIDEKILRELSTNARISIVALAEKLKLTRDIVNYRLKKLTKENIISQYRCYPNLEVIGKKLYKIAIRTKNFDDDQRKKLEAYSANHKSIPQILHLIGAWDLEIEIEVDSEDKMYEILSDIRSKFSDIIRDYDILRIAKTHKYNYFPFNHQP